MDVHAVVAAVKLGKTGISLQLHGLRTVGCQNGPETVQPPSIPFLFPGSKHGGNTLKEIA